MMSQTATNAWAEGNNDLDQEILATSLQKEIKSRPQTNDKASANQKKLPPMLPLDTSIQRLASREKTPPINKTDYISPDFGYQSIGSKAPSKEEQNEMKQ